MQTLVTHSLLILLVTSSSVLAQGSGSSRAARSSSSGSRRTNRSVPATVRPPSPQQFAASFWKYLHNPKSPYYRWGSPGKTDHQKTGTVPGAMGNQADTAHRGIGQTFLNSVANKQLKQVPYGSVFVREQYAPDQKTRENILVMYRSKGVDPPNKDWYWIVYKPDGSLATVRGSRGVRSMAGRIQSCVECHRHAAGSDFVFLNDKPVAPPSPKGPRGSGSHR